MPWNRRFEIWIARMKPKASFLFFSGIVLVRDPCSSPGG